MLAVGWTTPSPASTAAGRDHARQALGDDRQALLVGVRQQHCELVAADAPDQVGFAQAARQRAGDGPSASSPTSRAETGG